MTSEQVINYLRSSEISDVIIHDMLIALQSKILDACCEVANDYDLGRNYGLYMAHEIIGEELKILKEKRR